MEIHGSNRICNPPLPLHFVECVCVCMCWSASVSKYSQSRAELQKFYEYFKIYVYRTHTIWSLPIENSIQCCLYTLLERVYLALVHSAILYVALFISFLAPCACVFFSVSTSNDCRLLYVHKQILDSLYRFLSLSISVQSYFEAEMKFSNRKYYINAWFVYNVKIEMLFRLRKVTIR